MRGWGRMGREKPLSFDEHHKAVVLWGEAESYL